MHGMRGKALCEDLQVRHTMAAILLLASGAAFFAPTTAAAAHRRAAARLCAADSRDGPRVRRLLPGNNDECRKLSSLLVTAFYGEHAPLSGPLAWAQRGIIETDVETDLAARLRFYEAARSGEMPNLGAVFVAEDSDELLGFVDVGLPAYNPATGRFVLPKGDAQVDASDDTELRPYVSNLAVQPAARNRGVGRLLMEECERELQRWGLSYDELWLEVSLQNDAVEFYRKMGYEQTAQTDGNEVVRRAFYFELTKVKRAVMRKRIATASAAGEDSRKQLVELE